jgi:hypothetical protein
VQSTQTSTPQHQQSFFLGKININKELLKPTIENSKYHNIIS